MDYLAGVNRISALIRENKLDSKLRNENYCVENLGTEHYTSNNGCNR